MIPNKKCDGYASFTALVQILLRNVTTRVLQQSGPLEKNDTKRKMDHEKSRRDCKDIFGHV